MKCALLSLTMALAFACAANADGPIPKQEKKALDQSFSKLWNEPLVWKLDELPEKGYVHGHRIPYAGSIYPDNAGGTYHACLKYDYAFHGGRSLAASFESWDAQAHKTPTETPGLFGFRTVMRTRVPDWSGHCNGWAAAAIRHAEPTKSVRRNGVVFAPAEIKGLLAELYTFTESEMLGGSEEFLINPATFHSTLTNWVGRKKHAIAMESSPGKEVWNFPIYAYNMKIKKQGRTADVKVMMAYKHYTEQEYNKAPQNIENKYFHYQLTLNSQGEITGGSFYGDSSTIDFLWVPLTPTQGGKLGNENGNPHLNVDEVLSLWRDSVDKSLLEKWVNIETPKPAPPAATPDTEKPAGENADDTVAKAEN